MANNPEGHSPKWWRKHREKARKDPHVVSESVKTAPMVYFGFLHCQPLTWTYRKLFFAIQLGTGLAYLYFCYRIPSPGVAIGVLGAVAAVMAFRSSEDKEITERVQVEEKTLWILLIFSLMVIEIVSLGREHKSAEDHFTYLVNQGLGLSKQMAGLQSGTQAPQQQEIGPTKFTSQPPTSAVKNRGYLNLTTDGVGSSPQSDNRLFVNVICANAGPEKIENLDCGAGVIMLNENIDTFTKEKQEHQFQDYMKGRVFGGPHGPKTLVPGQNVWFSLFGPVVTPDLIQEFNNGKQLLVVMGDATYTDAVGKHRMEMCRFMQPPIDPHPVWRGCDKHNEEEY